MRRTCDPVEIARLTAPGECSFTVGSRDEAVDCAKQAFVGWEEVPEAVGDPYPHATTLRWFQTHLPKDIVRDEAGLSLPHIKYEDWTGGKKGKGGNWGHIFFPDNQPQREPS